MKVELPNGGRIELPSGGWVQVRTNLKGRDKIAVQRAVTVQVSDGKAQDVNIAMQTEMAYALMAQTIIAWSFEAPVPSQAGGVEALLEFDLDDLNALEVAVKPLVDAVGFTPPA